MIIDKDLHVLNRKVDYGIVGKKKLRKLLSVLYSASNIPFEKDMNQKKDAS